MFPSFARPRPLLFLLLLLFPFCCASENVLFTSSVTYCEPPESLLIQQFDLAYIAHNQTIFFNISAASVAANLTVTASILLNVYGLAPVNVTIHLCDLLAGALCPLPMYNFVGSDYISLPDSLGVFNRIPEVGFFIPDIEAYAQLILTEVGTGEIKACVQATLSNGKSTRQPAVEWATAGLALFALIFAAWQSVDPHAVVPYRLLDLLHLYQTIAATAFLSLNYPLLYRSFALNFAWAMGLVSSPNSSLQNSIDNMRALTGGHMVNASSGPAVGFVDRKLSPFNNNIQLPTALPASSFAQSFLAGPRAETIANISATAFARVASNGLKQLAVDNQVQTVTPQSSNILEAGIPIYVNSIHIATANAFMTTFLVALVVLAIVIALAVLAFAALYAAERYNWGNSETRQTIKSSAPAYARAWALRLGLVTSSPILIFVFYQWSLKDSWLSILISVLTFLAILVVIIYPAYLTLRLVRRESQDALETDAGHLAAHGPLYAQYRTPRYYFFLPLLFASFFKALVISAGQSNGFAQVILFMIAELGIVVAHIWLKPYWVKGGDVFSTYLAIVRLVCSGLLIAFVESINVNAILRVAIGAVIAVIFSIAVVVLAINLAIHAGLNRLWRRNAPARGPYPASSTNASTLEKGDIGLLEPKTDLTNHSRTTLQHTSPPSRMSTASIMSRTLAGSEAHVDGVSTAHSTSPAPSL